VKMKLKIVLKFSGKTNINIETQLKL